MLSKAMSGELGLNVALRLSGWLRLALSLHAGLFVVAYILTDSSSLIDAQGFVLILLLDLVLFLMLQYMPNPIAPQVLTVVTFELIFFLPRFFSYLLFPVDLLNYPFPSVFNKEDINGAVVFVILGTLALYFGFILAASTVRAQKSKKIIELPRILQHSRGILFAAVVVFGVDAAFYIVMDVNAYDVKTQQVPGVWLIHLFSIDVISGLVLCLAIVDRDFYQKNKVAIIILILFYLSYMTFLGSRGGVLRLAFFAFAALIARGNDFKLSFRMLGVILAVGLFGSVLTYTVGTVSRYVRTGMDIESSTQVVMSEMTRRDHGIKTDAVKECELAYSENGPNVTGDSKATACQSKLRFLSPILARLGVFDYVVEITSGRGDEAILSEYMNVSHALKNLANNLVIGTPLPESEIMTNRIITMAFRDISEEHVRSYVQSDPWTGWGLAYAFGGFSGGLVLLAVAGFAVQAAYSGLSRWSSSLGQSFLALFLFFVTLGCLLMNFGLDHALTLVAYTILALCTTLILIYLGSMLLGPRTRTAVRE